MSAAKIGMDELEQLVDRHIGLCEMHGSRGRALPKSPPLLITPNGGKGSWECLSDLVDNAMVAYQGLSCDQDPVLSSLKAALLQTILDMS